MLGRADGTFVICDHSRELELHLFGCIRKCFVGNFNVAMSVYLSCLGEPGYRISFFLFCDKLKLPNMSCDLFVKNVLFLYS